MTTLRYLVFAGEQYHPLGGWHDFVGEFNSLADATNACLLAGQYHNWGHVIDTHAQYPSDRFAYQWGIHNHKAATCHTCGKASVGVRWREPQLEDWKIARVMGYYSCTPCFKAVWAGEK